MRHARWMILCSGLATVGVGALLLLVSSEVEGVMAPAVLVLAGGVGLLVMWARGRGRWSVEEAPALSPAAEAELARKKRGLRFALRFGGVVMVVAGLIQGLSGEVYNRGTRRSIADPAGAWFVGGCLIVLGVGLMIGVLIAALRAGPHRPPSGE